MKLRLLLLTLIVLILSCKEEKSTTKEDATIVLDSLFEAFHKFKLEINPLEATRAGDSSYNDYLPNYISDAHQQKLLEKYTQFLSRIDDLDQAQLSQSQLMSLKAMKWDCEIKKEGLTNNLVTIASPMFDLPNFELMPINQIFSFHLEMGLLGSGNGAQPFKTFEDYKNWLKRLKDYIEWMETAIVNMEEGIEKEVVMPKVIIKRLIDQLDGYLPENIEDHLFYGPIKLLPDDFSEDDKKSLDTAFREMITAKMNPVHKKLKQFLIEKYLPAGTETSGIGALPNGQETYQYLIKYHTTTNMTPKEIHELGLTEVERISAEMEKVKEQVGFKGELKAFFDFVRNSPEQMPFTEPEQVIANFNAIHETMKDNLDKLFDLKPKAGFKVRRVEAFREKSASAEYFAGSKDGSRPGTFYVPIPDVENYNKFQDESLFLHEAIPGHHYQLSLQQENESLPAFQHAEGMGVFVEGWALYSESLGKELGLYTDPYQYFGMLSAEMHRAIRLVVDSGMHALGWSREQAIQYSLDHEAESEAGITSEIERYMVGPGQALSYKMGQLKIRELRDRAKEALGDDFSIKEFHNQVLNSGSLPLVLLEEKINNWIEKTSRNE
ncbi:uncharacterized protein (DUF885 family) [Saonia flava]|uniref:Uncharacterized protein (DUF885 family) n=1 Tax=Saonia flava TaxID=523696 RepID=A0A846R0X1_9FLAO|nr:DUF885 domain-containing protein [Saonia flava]NJB72602.1 uncharacterized protein (DUF885 family) [Saonia flava]